MLCLSLIDQIMAYVNLVGMYLFPSHVKIPEMDTVGELFSSLFIQDVRGLPSAHT